MKASNSTVLGYLKLLVAMMALQLAPSQCSGFWLTDSTIFARPNPTVVASKEQPAKVELTGESWIRVDGSSSEPNQEQCKCNPDWLHNQTGSILSKWLQSPNVASQMRALILSNSTGAHIGGPKGEEHLAAGRKPTTGRPPRADSNNAFGGWLVGRSARNSGNNANNQAKQAKIIQGERGPQGPKGDAGERGERGERGPAGLISVKDRDALFDLASSDQQQLAYLESEQSLVFGSTKLGWRPLQLLSPLRDFRKTIAEFSLTAAGARKLAADGSRQYTDNSIKPLDSGAGSRDEDDSGVDEADDQGPDGEDEDEEGEEEDEEEEDDQDESEDEAESPSKRVVLKDSRSTGSSGTIDRPDEEQVSRANRARTPIRHSLITGRSATAALVEASIENSLTSQSPISSTLRQAEQVGQMQLRLVALNEPFAGNVHGIRGADFECRREAARAQVKGSFRAFLASGFQNLNEIVRFQGQKYPIANLRGEILADSWQDLLRSPLKVQNPLTKLYSFDGRHVATHSNWPNKLIWHGTGNRQGQRDSRALNCDGWHSDSMSKFGFATPLHMAANNHQDQHHTRKRPNQQQNAPIKRQHPDDWRSKHQKRYSNTNSTFPLAHLQGIDQHNPMLLELIDKYPCRMPLIVLCIETIGQPASFPRTTSSGNEVNPIEYNPV